MKIDESISFLEESKQMFLQEQLSRLTIALKDLEYIILFGSYARGEEKSCSDMDLLAITMDETDRLVRGDLCSKLEEKNIDVVFYTLDTFQKSECLFIQQVKREGIILWKKS